jgi:hypothetical protein
MATTEILPSWAFAVYLTFVFTAIYFYLKS